MAQREAATTTAAVRVMVQRKADGDNFPAAAAAMEEDDEKGALSARPLDDGASGGDGRASMRVWAALAGAWNLRRNAASIFDRKSSRLSIKRSHALDGLRALSVLWVTAFHVMTTVIVEGLMPMISNLITFWPAQVVFNGEMGVDVFFALSGYVVCPSTLSLSLPNILSER